MTGGNFIDGAYFIFASKSVSYFNIACDLGHGKHGLDGIIVFLGSYEREQTPLSVNPLIFFYEFNRFWMQRYACLDRFLSDIFRLVWSVNKNVFVNVLWCQFQQVTYPASDKTLENEDIPTHHERFNGHFAFFLEIIIHFFPFCH